jgi:hypothetical protein
MVANSPRVQGRSRASASFCRSLILLVVLLSTLVFFLAVMPASAGVARLSLRPDGSQIGNGGWGSDVSADGRFVLFGSSSADMPGYSGLYLLDRATGSVRLASCAADGTPGLYFSGNGYVSTDGRYVIFSSYSTNLVPGVFHTGMNVFLKDMLLGTVQEISHTSSGGFSNNTCNMPTISDDGGLVVFESFATNMTPDDTNGAGDIYAFDRSSGQLRRLVDGYDGSQTNDGAESPSLTRNGRYLVFESWSSNIVENDTNGIADIFVMDLLTGEVDRASMSSSGGQANKACVNPRISNDGRYVVFQSDATNLVPVIPGDNNYGTEIYLRDRLLRTTERISAATNGGHALGGCRDAQVSDDGRYVSFASAAYNLVAGDTNGTFDVFRRDRAEQSTLRVSVGSSGEQGNGQSTLGFGRAVTADGSFGVFVSEANNLVPSDTNGAWDTFGWSLPTNAPPTVTLPADPAVNEGSVFAGSGFFTDADSVSWTATVDYGDGSGLQSLPLDADKSFSLDHSFDRAGSYTMQVTVTDQQGLAGTASGTVIVNNLPPALGPIGVTVDAGSEGKTVSARVAFTDAGTETFTAVWNWGDGTTSAGSVTFTRPTGVVTGTHTYQQAGMHIATVTVIDSGPMPNASAQVSGPASQPLFFDGFEQADGPPIDWDPVGPPLSGGGPTTWNVVHWGQHPGGALTPIITGYMVTTTGSDWSDYVVQVSKSEPASCEYFLLLRFQDMDNYIMWGRPGDDMYVAVVSGGRTIFYQTIPGAPTFHYPETLTAVVEGLHIRVYSDGVFLRELELPEGTPLQGRVGLRTPHAGQLFDDVAVYPVTTPQVTTPNPETIDEGRAFTAAGFFSDANPDDNFTATVDYGDGSGEQALALSPGRSFDLSHLYADNGTYTLTVTVTDGLGATGSAATIVTVENVQPVVTTLASATLDEGGVFVGSASFTDPGADYWLANVDYGDGTPIQSLDLGADKTFALTHLYRAASSYTLTVTVTDDDGGIGSASMVITVQHPDLSTGHFKITLVDEAGIPLANYPADYPTETRNLQYKYRHGGSWAPTVSFQTDENGQAWVTIDPSYLTTWDKKVTVTLNQTTKEQDMRVSSVFQAARVDVNLKSSTGPISEATGGSVDQGGGFWYHHGNTATSGTVSFYAFPGTVKVRMSYNHNTQTLFPVVTAGTNEVDFLATAVTLIWPGDIKSNKGGSWWYFTKPTMYLLPGDYSFWVKQGTTWLGPTVLTVSGDSLVEDFQ